MATLTTAIANDLYTRAYTSGVSDEELAQYGGWGAIQNFVLHPPEPVLTPEYATQLMHQSMTTGVATATLDAVGGYDKVAAVYAAAGGTTSIDEISATELKQLAQTVAETGVGNMAILEITKTPLTQQAVVNMVTNGIAPTDIINVVSATGTPEMQVNAAHIVQSAIASTLPVLTTPKIESDSMIPTETIRQNLYIALLGRDPVATGDTAGLQYWADEAARNNWTFDQLKAQFLSSVQDALRNMSASEKAAAAPKLYAGEVIHTAATTSATTTAGTVTGAATTKNTLPLLLAAAALIYIIRGK